MLKKICGVYLIAIAVVVAVQTVAEPLYHVSGPGQPYSPIWTLINPLTALAIVLGVIFAYTGKQDAGGQTVTREFLVSNALLYGFLFVGIIFFWNWFNILSPEFTAVGDDAISLAWIIIDAAVPLLAGVTGIRLLRGGSSGG